MTAVGTAPETASPAPDDEPDPLRPALWRRVAGATVPPLIALVVGWITLAYRSGNLGKDPWRPSIWGHWDSGWYLKIAREGYFVTWDCPARSLPPSAPKDGKFLCGSAGWFPGYPAADRAVVAVTGLSHPVAALVVSWTSWFVVLVLMWQLLRDARLPARWLCLGIAAFFPGMVYFAAVFPVSLTVAGMLGCLCFATHRTRPLVSGLVAAVAGAAAAYSYITPIALAPALVLTALLAVRGRQRLQALIAAAGVVAGFAAVLLTFQLSVGIWNAYFYATAKFGVGANSPIATLLDRIRPLWTEQPPGREFRSVSASQTLLTLGLIVLATAVVVVGAALARRRPEPDPEPDAEPEPEPEKGSRYARWYPALTRRVSPRDLAFLLAAGGVWLVPYVAGGGASTYRSEAFVILSVPLLRRLPWWVLAPILALVVITAWRMAPNFFNGKLA